MANGNLPNPAFGNDPATLLGSLIVEIGDLQQDQKATTARIENLDENEDRSTTLIENAVRDDIKEGIKRTQGILDLKKGVGSIKTYTQEVVDRAEEKYKADLYYQEQVMEKNKNIDVSDRIETQMRESLREIQNYFNKNNPDGIVALGKGIIGGLDTFTQFDKGASQLSRGFNNLFDGMGALGPVVNAFKTGLNKAVAGFDVVVGLTRSTIGAIRGVAGFAKNLFTGEFFAPRNKIAEEIEKGEAVIEKGGNVSDDSLKRGDEKNPLFIDFTQNALNSLTDAFNNFTGSTVIEGQFEELEESQKIESKKADKFRKASLEGIKEQDKRFRRGIPRFAIYIGGFLLLIFALITSLLNFFTNPSLFFKNTGGGIAGASRSIFAQSKFLDRDDFDKFNPSQSKSPKPGFDDDDFPDKPRKPLLERPGVKNPPGVSVQGKGPRDVPINPENPSAGRVSRFSLKGFLDNADGGSGVAGSLYKTRFMDAVRGYTVTGQLINEDGTRTTLARSLTNSERRRVMLVRGLRALPMVALGSDVILTASELGMARYEVDTLYETRIPVSLGGREAAPLSEQEYIDLMKMIDDREAAQYLGTLAGFKLALETGKYGFKAFGKTPISKDPRARVGGSIVIVLGSAYAGITGDALVAETIETGLNIFDPKATDSRFSDLSQIQIEKSAIEQMLGDEDMNLFRSMYVENLMGYRILGDTVGRQSTPMVIDNSDNTVVNTTGGAPANDEFLEKSQQERSGYFMPGL